MRFYYLSILFLSLFLSNYSICQQKAIDSLEIELLSTEGERKVDILISLSDSYLYVSTDKCFEFAHRGIKLAKMIDYKKGLANAYGSLGFAYIGLNTKKAKEYTRKALEIRELTDDQIGISKSLNVLGVVHYFAGEYLLSIEYHLNSIKLKEEIGNKEILATSYNNISLVYIAVENYEKALEYLYKALEIRTSANNLRGVGIIKTNIGDIYLKKGSLELAHKFLEESLKINLDIGSTKASAGSYNILARLLTIKKDYKKALNYYESALEGYKKLKIKNGIADVENGLAELYKILEDYNSSIEHALIAKDNAVECNSLENIYRASSILSFCYQKKGNIKKAFDAQLVSIEVQNSLWDEAKLKKMSKIELDHKIEKMRLEQEIELNKQKVFNNYLVFFLILGGVFIVIIIYYGRNKKIVNDKLNKLNLKLTENNSTKDRFLSIIAHDLRGPYQSNLGISEYLVKEFNTLTKEEINSSIRNLHTSLNKQYELLDNLLKWGNLKRGNFLFNKEKLSLKECLEDVFQLLELTAKNKDIILINNVDGNIFINADKNMLYLILRNLIINSIKFSYKDNTVEVNAIEKDGNIQVMVVDNGIGIEEKILDDLFKIDVHYTIKGTDHEDGSGLGLILCKEIIEKHGGSIWAKSKVNEGSQFIFTLPIK